MQCGEFRGAEAGFLFHEMRLHEIAVGDERFCEGQADHAFRQMGFHVDELVVGEDEFRGR